MIRRSYCTRTCFVKCVRMAIETMLCCYAMSVMSHITFTASILRQKRFPVVNGGAPFALPRLDNRLSSCLTMLRYLMDFCRLNQILNHQKNFCQYLLDFDMFSPIYLSIPKLQSLLFFRKQTIDSSGSSKRRKSTHYLSLDRWRIISSHGISRCRPVKYLLIVQRRNSGDWSAVQTKMYVISYFVLKFNTFNL